MFKDTDKFNGQMCVFVNFERIFCTTMFMLKSTCMTYHVSALIKEHICHLLKNEGCFDFSSIDPQLLQHVNVEKLRIPK